ERFQLGLGDRFNRAEPCKITFPPAEDGQEPRIAAVACGEQHLLCLSRNGAVYSCGLGVFGQLGHGVKRDERRPKAIAAFAEECSPIVQVSCGANHSAALDASGAAWLWGHAEYSQLGASSAHQDWGGGDRGSGSAFPTPKRFAFFETVQPPVRIREISCGDLFTLALTSRSEVFAWGWNQSGALGMGNRRFLQQPSQVLHLQGEDIRSISAGGVHSLAINGSGTSLFAYDFKDFVGSPKFSDISFLVQSVTVPAHRILIFLRCPHLAAMLIMAERFHPQTRSSSAASSSALTAFPLPGVKVHVFRALLSYLYTDHLKCTPHWLQELRELALKFRLSHLAFLCARQMTPLKDLPAFDLLPRVPSSFAADMERGIGAAQHADILLGALPDGLFEQPNASPPPETKDQSLTTGDSHKPHDAQEPFKIGQLQVVVKPSSLCHQYAHRVILAARCRSLRLIFDRSSLSEAKCESQTKRLATKLLDFEDLSESSLETLLRYLYCGDESPLSNPDMLVPMLMISHRFQLTDLKQICELHLQEVVSHDNVGCILILADRYQAPRLRKYCLNHLKLHWASLVHSPAISDIKDAAPQLVDIVEHYVKFCPLPLDCLPEGPSSSSI
ncbi:MAG: BTB/POZ domain-containing protein, partial [archaeon]|nr:BTB/POZ domain-containing protein [archaeon]